jgi:hypothetical protein
MRRLILVGLLQKSSLELKSLAYGRFPIAYHVMLC